jgi:hypothetical protein
MCENRILGRISSKRLGADYGKQGKTFLGTAIQQAADAVRKYGDKKRFGPAIEKFLRDAAGLQRRLTRLEACETGDVPSHIGEVIRACHQLNKTTNFDEFFSGITTKQLDPSSKKYLTTRLSKLARYQECFLYLLKSAKAYGIFEQVDVTAVSPEPEFFNKFNLPANCSLTGCLSRCQNGASVIFGAKTISKKLNLKLDIIKREFTSTIEKVQQGSRVHAEVQIVSHYELHPAAKMPRIICSSKNACYLCNLFIQLHGAFYIPRTHGNLYFRWRMLSIPSLSQLQAQLNSALEARIRVALQSIMAASNPRRVLAPNENESAIFPFSRSMSSVASSLLLSQAASKRNSAGTSTDEPPAEQETQPSSPELPLQPLKPALRPESNNMVIHGEPVERAVSFLREPPEPVQMSINHPHQTTEGRTTLGLGTGPAGDATALPASIPTPGSEPEPGPGPKQDPAHPRNPSPNPTITPSSPGPGVSYPPSTSPRPQILLTPDQPTSFLILPTATTTGSSSRSSSTNIPTYTTGLITIMPKFINSLAPQRHSLPIEIRLHWLPRERAAAFYDARPRGFVLLEDEDEQSVKPGLKGVGAELDAGSAECVYLAYGGQVVMLEVLRGVHAAVG